MVGGEGAGTVLEGFTVTGGETSGGQVGYSGIWCDGLSPTIRDCILRDNSGGEGGGVYGNARLERCTIRDNDALPYGRGGGVYGRPTLVDCVVEDNRSGDLGGGIYATGPCSIVRTVIDGNVAGNGSDGYSAGGVYGPATLIGCRITNNVAHHHLDGSGQPGLVGTAVHGAVLVARCTVSGNRVGNGPFPGDPSGALLGVTRVVDSILWGDELREIGGYGSWLPSEVRHSTVQGGWPGTGNLALDPLFRDAPSGDYFLEPGSLAIDAGDPAGPLDPDGTRADMGALFFPQFPAALALRNGTGVNPVSYRSVLRPVIGSTWTASVDATAHGSPVAPVVLLGSTRAATVPRPGGELLLDLGAPTFLLGTRVPTGGVAVFSLALPRDHALGGLTLATQALVVGPALDFSNALDLTLGL
jgi:predicted outer membrane repeat protein